MTITCICALLLVSAVIGHPVDKHPKWVVQQSETSQVKDDFPSRNVGLGTGGGVGGYHGVFRHDSRPSSGHRSFPDDSQVKVDVDDVPRTLVDGIDSQDKIDNFNKPRVTEEGNSDTFKPIVEDHSNLPNGDRVKPHVPVYRSERPVIRTEQRPGRGNIKPLYYDPKDTPYVQPDLTPKEDDKPKIEIALVDDKPSQVSPNQDGFGYVEQGKVADGNSPVEPDLTPIQQDQDTILPNKPYDTDSRQPILPNEHSIDEKDSVQPSNPDDSENSDQPGPFQPNQQTDSEFPEQSYQPQDKDIVQPNQQYDSPDSPESQPNDQDIKGIERPRPLKPIQPNDQDIKDIEQPRPLKPIQPNDQDIKDIEQPRPLQPIQPNDQDIKDIERPRPLQPIQPNDQDIKDIEQPRPLQPIQPYDTQDQVKPIESGDEYPRVPSGNPSYDVQVQSKDDYVPDQEKPLDEVPEKGFPLPGDNQPIIPEEPVGPVGSLEPEKPFGPSQDGVENRPLIPQGSNKPVDEKLTPTTAVYPAMRDLCQNLDLKRFMTLIDRADMGDVFTNKGPVTIFAPSDQAFSRLPVHVYYRLTRDNVFLKQVLQYHIIEGLHPIRGDELDSKSEGIGYYQTQAPSLKLFFNNYGQDFYVNGLPVSKASQRASNGMIHVLDNVLYPVPTKNLPETLQSTPTFTRFHALAKEAGLFDNELEVTKGAHTIFVPSDQAFAKLPRRTMEWLSFDKDALKALLLKHIVPGAHFSSWVNDAGITYDTLTPNVAIEIKHAKDHYTANGIRVGNHDIVTQNGVIHSVNEVLFAKELQPKVDYKRPTLKRIYPSSISY